MMIERSYYDRYGEWRRCWRLLLVRPYLGSYWLWDNFCRPLTERCYFWPVDFAARTTEGADCYCPSGSQSLIELALFGFRVSLHCSRERGKRPCVCDIALYDSGWYDADDIEEKGGAAAFERAREWWERFCKGKSPTRYRGWSLAKAERR